MRYSELSIYIPFISLFLFILIERISAHIRKRYGVIGSPWRHPRSSLKKFDRKPTCVTADTVFN